MCVCVCVCVYVCVCLKEKRNNSVPVQASLELSVKTSRPISGEYFSQSAKHGQMYKAFNWSNFNYNHIVSSLLLDGRSHTVAFVSTRLSFSIM